ncbi:MAG: hypothetical protein ACOCRX_09055 [Candidatus Woesearchaeota archaeon]
MVNVWINKHHKEKINTEFKDALVYNIFDENQSSNIKTDVDKLWKSINVKHLSPIYEDLLLISIVVIALDKHISRSYFEDK